MNDIPLPRFNLWCRQGIPHSEIRRRISERSDDECLKGYAWLHKNGFLPEDISLAMADMANDHRDTNKVLDLVEPQMRASWANLPFEDVFLEVNALAVEQCVRMAQTLFP